MLNESEKANELNRFYARFDGADFSYEQEEALQTLSTDCSPITIDQREVQRLFARMCPKKAAGPDGISGRLLKSCHEELAEAFCPINQLSMDLHTVPSIWKDTIIIPVPKRACVKENNDLRPVALTSMVMKGFEKVTTRMLKDQVSGALAPHQVANRCNRRTDDAVVSLGHYISKHLEVSTTYAQLCT